MTDPAKYWPGGIPAHILCHDEPIVEGLAEECKGWQLLLEENAQLRELDSDDANFEVGKRRGLDSFGQRSRRQSVIRIKAAHQIAVKMVGIRQY
ncbi:hypothetical protein BX600DRAFT_555578 [Xylariales sp. PMI_506]|nr:hypothetical protein BX600DRAFT_555578 [Xylariales sp. PMI_506]